MLPITRFDAEFWEIVIAGKKYGALSAQNAERQVGTLDLLHLQPTLLTPTKRYLATATLVYYDLHYAVEILLKSSFSEAKR